MGGKGKTIQGNGKGSLLISYTMPIYYPEEYNIHVPYLANKL